jgi:hypothetical protein
VEAEVVVDWPSGNRGGQPTAPDGPECLRRWTVAVGVEMAAAITTTTMPWILVAFAWHCKTRPPQIEWANLNFES